MATGATTSKVIKRLQKLKHYALDLKQSLLPNIYIKHICLGMLNSFFTKLEFRF